MKSANKANLIIVLAALLGGAAGLTWSLARQADEVEQREAGSKGYIGTPAPMFSIKDLNRQSVDLEQLRGTPVLLNFWGTWCPPCRKEIPDLMEAHRDLADTRPMPASIIGIAVDEPEPVNQFAMDYQINYPILTPGYQKGYELSISYGNTTGAYPYSVFIDREGNIDRITVGLLDVAEAMEYLTGL